MSNTELKDNFYTISDCKKSNDGFAYTIKLNSNHWVFEVHFAGNPITPGAFLLQITKELISTELGKQISINKTQNIRFLNAINPIENPIVEFVFTKDEANKLNIVIKHDETMFAKIKLTYSVHD